MEELRKMIEVGLMDYKLQYNVYIDDEVTHMPLVDKLCPEGVDDISAGKEEIEYLADEICQIVEEWMKPLPTINTMPEEIRKFEYIKKTDALNLLDSFFVNCDGDGNYHSDPSCNQLIDEIKKHIFNLVGEYA